MAYPSGPPNEMWLSLRRLLLGLMVVLCLALFVLWRADSPRMEMLRANVADTLLPTMEWTSQPLGFFGRIAGDFRSYTSIYDQNQELRRELRRMEAWRELALQLEQDNAELRALANVRLQPRMTHITGEILSDTGGPFSQSGLLNIGGRNGVRDGSAAVDGLGLVGRVAGVGERTARILYLTDINSRVPVVVQGTGQRSIVLGDNTAAPVLEFVAEPELIRPGQRVVTSGDGRVFPADILVGQVITGPDGRLRVRPAADYRTLEFVQVLNFQPAETVADPRALIDVNGLEGAQ